MPKRLCNQFLPKTLRFSLQRHKSCKKLRFLRLFAGFFMEGSCRGFFASNWLCSKPGRSLCEIIKLTFAIAPGCLHSLRSVDMTVFASGSSYFINSRVQKLKNSAKQNSWIVCRFPAFASGNFCFPKALCKSSRILQSRILGEFAGSRFGTRRAVSGFGLRV